MSDAFSFSNDVVEIDRAAGVVTKRAVGHLNAVRLISQMQKQARFLEERATAHLRTPRVLSHKCWDDAFEFAMEYVDGVHPLLASKWDSAVGALARWVAGNATSAVANVGRDLAQFIARVRLEMRGTPDENNALVADALAKVESRTSWVNMPVGYAHGDMTLCNALVDAQGVMHLIDFHREWASTPVIDGVKLRQDTRHGWVDRFTPVPLCVRADADAIVLEEMRVVPGFKAWSAVLGLFDLVRVLRYAHKPQLAAHRAYLLHEIEGALRCIR